MLSPCSSQWTTVNGTTTVPHSAPLHNHLHLFRDTLPVFHNCVSLFLSTTKDFVTQRKVHAYQLLPLPFFFLFYFAVFVFRRIAAWRIAEKDCWGELLKRIRWRGLPLSDVVRTPLCLVGMLYLGLHTVLLLENLYCNLFSFSFPLPLQIHFTLLVSRKSSPFWVSRTSGELKPVAAVKMATRPITLDGVVLRFY